MLLPQTLLHSDQFSKVSCPETQQPIKLSKQASNSSLLLIKCKQYVRTETSKDGTNKKHTQKHAVISSLKILLQLECVVTLPCEIVDTFLTHGVQRPGFFSRHPVVPTPECIAVNSLVCQLLRIVLHILSALCNVISISF